MLPNVNALAKSIVILVIVAAALILAQMWLSLFAMDTFIKLLATTGIIGLVICVVIGIRQDLSDEKKLKDDKFLD